MHGSRPWTIYTTTTHSRERERERDDDDANKIDRGCAVGVNGQHGGSSCPSWGTQPYLRVPCMRLHKIKLTNTYYHCSVPAACTCMAVVQVNMTCNATEPIMHACTYGLARWPAGRPDRIASDSSLRNPGGRACTSIHIMHGVLAWHMTQQRQ